jgi:DNA-binding NtrC family response regulator
MLLDHFLQLFASRFGKKLSGFSDKVRGILLNYHYPGNVRELKNIVEYAVNICQEDKIRPEHLPAYLTDSLWRAEPEPGMEAALPEPEAGPATSGPSRNWTEIERQMIVDALVRARGRRSRAADLLGWGRSTLWRKMKQHGLDE